MADVKQFTQLTEIPNGTTSSDNIKFTDVVPMQHIDLSSGTNTFNKIYLGQCFCQPIATCSSGSGGTYTATCSNFPDFAISYTDSESTIRYLVGLKVRVIFSVAVTYGSVSGGTCPQLNISGSGALPMLAQGKTMAAGAIVAGQSVEFTLIPYGNSYAWDCDSNVRESTSDYTIYTDGRTVFESVIEFLSRYSSVMWGYYHRCGTRIFVKIKMILTSSLSDWATLTEEGVLPSPTSALTIPADGKSGASNSIHISSRGQIHQAGGGGMSAGTYEFTFDYELS